jgi:hypothetical protein
MQLARASGAGDSLDQRGFDEEASLTMPSVSVIIVTYKASLSAISCGTTTWRISLAWWVGDE